MSHLLLYCGLVDARISSSEKDLPVYDSFKCKDTAYLAGFVTAGFAKFALTFGLLADLTHFTFVLLTITIIKLLVETQFFRKTKDRSTLFL